MAKKSEQQKLDDALTKIRSDVRYLRRIISKGTVDDTWEAIGDSFWYQVSNYPNGNCKLVIRAYKGPRKGLSYTLFAVTDDGVMEFPIDDVSLTKTDDAYIATFEGRIGGYICVFPNTLL